MRNLRNLRKTQTVLKSFCVAFRARVRLLVCFGNDRIGYLIGFVPVSHVVVFSS